MNFTFENQGTNTYLVYEVSSTDIVDSMSLGMITNNKIQGLASTLFMQVDTTKYIKYNVSAKISVKQFFVGPVNRKRLLGVFTGIVDAMMAAEDYMIDVNSVLLDTEYIFADVSTCETVLICLPITNLEVQSMDLGAFFKNIMFTTQFDQTENCDYVAKLINYLNSTPVFSIVDFKELLQSLNNEKEETVRSNVQAAVQQATPQPSVPVQPMRVEQPKVQTPQPQVVQPQTPQVVPVQPVNIPTPVPVETQVVQEQGNKQEKQMSMMNLLMHYNKENAALYKAQKEAKKIGKPVVSVPTPQSAPKPQKAKPTPAPRNQGFAIPGQSVPNTPFAIPGQPTPAPTPSKPVAPAPAANRHVTPQPVVQQAMAPQPAQPVQPVQPMVASQPVVSEGKPLNFGETTVLNAGMLGETTVLNAGMLAQEVKVQPHLIRAKNNERIELNKPVFRIGKEKSYVDYFIGDNTAISRSHANIISRDGEYFVVDTNSTNHTYVGGIMIQSNVETKLEDGTKVRLANEDFEFKLR